MDITLEPLNDSYGACIEGVNIGNGISDDEFDQIRDAFETHSVLVLPEQQLDDAKQIAFSERFGSLEYTVPTNQSGGSYFAVQSNLDVNTGEPIPQDDRRLFYQKANMLWHSDSSFREPRSLCSILSAQEVPPSGGATEFASTCTVYDHLDENLKQELEELEVEHDINHSRQTVGYVFTDAEAAAMPPARHSIVQTNPVTGRKSLLIGSHAKRIIGWPENRSRILLDELLDKTTQPDNCYHHEWKTGDVVIWDNRSVLHRATPFDAGRYRRIMQRTTVSLAE